MGARPRLVAVDAGRGDGPARSSAVVGIGRMPGHCVGASAGRVNVQPSARRRGIAASTASTV